MAKGRGGMMIPGAGGKQPDMMRQLARIQEQMLAEQQALADETVEISVGGGAVKVVMTGHQKLQSVQIQPELLSPEEAEMLSDLLISAVNQAVEKSQAMAGSRMQSVTSGLGLPPGFGF
jgi:DNA-binding YbaB/EbfC family protein